MQSIEQAVNKLSSTGNPSITPAKESATVASNQEVLTASNTVSTDSKLSYAERKEFQKKLKKAERAVEESEKKIEKLEARKQELDDLLMQPANVANMELVNEYTDLQRKLDEENTRWLKLSEELEELQ